MAAFAKRLQKNDAVALTDVEVLASPDRVTVSATTESARSADSHRSLDGATEGATSLPQGTPGQKDVQETSYRNIDEL